MNVASWQHYRLDPKKMLLLGVVTAAASGVTVDWLASGVLGSSSLELSIVIGAVACYLALSFPKRLLESSALSQSKEAPALAVMGSANVEATRSRAMSFLLLRSGEPDVSEALRAARAQVLLGNPPLSALQRSERQLASYSVRNVLRSVATLQPGSIVEGGEESQGIARASQLSEESTLPLFTAVAFFSPIMLLLYVIMGHHSDPTSLSEVVALQVFLLDIAFHFSSSERRRLG